MLTTITIRGLPKGYIFLAIPLIMMNCRKSGKAALRTVRSAGYIQKHQETDTDGVKTFVSDNEVFLKINCPVVNGMNCYKIYLQLPADTTNYMSIYANKIPELIDIQDEDKTIVKVEFFLPSSIVNGFNKSNFTYHKGKLITD